MLMSAALMFRTRVELALDEFTLLDSDLDSDSDYCTMQKLPVGSDSDSDPLIEV